MHFQMQRNFSACSKLMRKLDQRINFFKSPAFNLSSHQTTHLKLGEDKKMTGIKSLIRILLEQFYLRHFLLHEL